MRLLVWLAACGLLVYSIIGFATYSPRRSGQPPTTDESQNFDLHQK